MTAEQKYYANTFLVVNLTLIFYNERARSVTLYHYCSNDPINRIDPTGMTDYHTEDGTKIGNDGNANGQNAIVTNKNDIDLITGNYKNKSVTPLDNLSTSPLMLSNTALQTSLDIYNGTNKATESDNVGGLHGETALVFNDGTVTRGASGAKGSVIGNNFITNENLPDFPAGYSASNLEVIIHSHATEIFNWEGKWYGGNALTPSGTDQRNPLFNNNTNIIVGPLGPFKMQTDSYTGGISPKRADNGIVIYKGGQMQMKLTIGAVKKILK